VPLVDLCEIALGTPSRKWMSTRIILVKYPLETGKTHLLGILAEHATETFRRPEEDFQDSGVAMADASWLGPVLTDAAGIVQRIEISRLLPRNLCNQLFCQSAETA
jgi:chemotaxis-related protein WspB